MLLAQFLPSYLAVEYKRYNRMHITVSAYLFPLEDEGWNSPIKSIDMNFIGAGSASKLYLLYFTASLLCSWQNLQDCTCFLNHWFQSFPKIMSFE